MSLGGFRKQELDDTMHQVRGIRLTRVHSGGYHYEFLFRFLMAWGFRKSVRVDSLSAI